MSANVVIAGGAGDNAASAIGLGAIAPGDAFLSLGTSGVLFRVTDRFAPAPASAVHAFCHALPGLWHQMGVMLSAAASLAWLAGVLATPATALLALFGESVERHDAIGRAGVDAGARHAPDDARRLVLHEGGAADRLDGAHALGAVAAHAGHDDADGAAAEDGGGRAHGDICRRAHAVHFRIFGGA